MIGRVFDDRYEVIKKLGSGGFADVYLANDRLLGRQVALKVLSARYANDEQFVERFRREASSAAGLNHPNIVQIYDRGEAEGTYYIAMEYLEGRSLKEIIVKYAPLSPELVVSVAVQILEALRFAHRRDVIHRDIKPQNIIVDNDGRVKVTDFGIARAGSASTMTEAGSILGTAHYFSPEQAQGQQVEAASDLYSLGVMMFEMTTGRLPFDGDNPVSIAMKHVHDQPPAPRNINPHLPENLEAVILRSMGKRPVDRYLTAQAMLEDMRRVQAGDPVTAPNGFADEATRVMTPAAVGAAGGAASMAQATQIRRRPPDQPMSMGGEEPGRPRRVWPWILVIILILALAAGAYVIYTNWNTAEAQLGVVPGVVGLTEAEAIAKIQAAGFDPDKQGVQPSADVPEGDVARQDPENGARIEKGKTVGYWVSSGEGKVTVPNVVGMSQVNAAAALAKAGLDVATKEEVNPDEAVGTVLRQNPEADKEVDAGTTVTITVAAGSNTVKVPDLGVGIMTQDTAVALLNSMDLVAKTEAINSTLPGGTVVDQNPKGGEEVEPGSPVTIYISNAPVVTTVKVPAVAALGLTEAQAKARLAQYGLKAKVVDQETPDFKPGLCIYQDPAAGFEVKIGSTVQIWIAREPVTTTTTTAPPTTTTTAAPTTTTASTTTTVAP